MIMDARKQRNVWKLRSDVLGGQRISGLSALAESQVQEYILVTHQETPNKCSGKNSEIDKGDPINMLGKTNSSKGDL